MFVLDSLLVGGLRFVLDTIAEVADRELRDPERWRAMLLEAQLAYENGAISSEELSTREREILARLRELHPEADGAVLSSEDFESVEVVADPAGLTRVVSNLLMNAIRHTPADGVVEVSGGAADGGVVLSVSDGCGGLAPEDIERVFDLGWQGSPARTAGPVENGAPPGAGLGLAVVKGIVEAHRGRVWVESLEGGCRFHVAIPAR